MYTGEPEIWKEDFCPEGALRSFVEANRTAADAAFISDAVRMIRDFTQYPVN